MHPEQKKIYQSMTPGKKLQAALRLYYSAREFKAAGIKKHNPGLHEEEIQEKVREAFLYART